MEMGLREYLVNAGWHNSASLTEVLERAVQLVSQKGINDHRYLDKLLRREFDESLYKLQMGSESPLGKAIQCHSKEEQVNLAKAEKSIREMLRSPVVSGGSLMPDACPAGSQTASLPVGGAVIAESAIIPAAHSSDICCSLWATFYSSELELEDEITALQQATRFGPGGREEPVSDPVTEENVWSNKFLKGLRNKAVAHMADQGDGNHFAFLGSIEVTAVLLEHLEKYEGLSAPLAAYRGQTIRVLVTHHGSRGLGATVFKRGLDAAKKHVRKVAVDVPESAAWLDAKSEEGEEYWQALQYVARWTKANHKSIHQRFLRSIETQAVTQVGNEHNFVWRRGDQFFHGKGATPAWKDEAGLPLLGLIPLNMAQPILLVKGRDNQAYHSFAPHGAGRNMSRTALVRKLCKQSQPMEQQLKQSTASIAVRWYLGEPDITESPLGYKDAATVVEQIVDFDLAEVIGEILPRASIMAGRSPRVSEKPMTAKQIRQLGHRAERRKQNQRDWERGD